LTIIINHSLSLFYLNNSIHIYCSLLITSSSSFIIITTLSTSSYRLYIQTIIMNDIFTIIIIFPRNPHPKWHQNNHPEFLTDHVKDKLWSKCSSTNTGLKPLIGFKKGIMIHRAGVLGNLSQRAESFLAT